MDNGLVDLTDDAAPDDELVAVEASLSEVLLWQSERHALQFRSCKRLCSAIVASVFRIKHQSCAFNTGGRRN